MSQFTKYSEALTKVKDALQGLESLANEMDKEHLGSGDFVKGVHDSLKGTLEEATSRPVFRMFLKRESLKRVNSNLGHKSLYNNKVIRKYVKIARQNINASEKRARKHMEKVDKLTT